MDKLIEMYIYKKTETKNMWVIGRWFGVSQCCCIGLVVKIIV